VFVVELISLNSPIILDYFLHNRKWMRWITFNKPDSNDPQENVRFQAEKIVLALVPEAFSYVTLKPKENSQTEFEEEVDDFNVYPPQDLSEVSKFKLNIILDELMNMFKDPSLRDMCGAEKSRPQGEDVIPKDAFKLTSLFRLIEWALVSNDEKTKFISDLKVKETIVILYKAIEKREIENDYNKHYFFKLWDRLTDNHEEASSFFGSTSEWCGAWISLREKPIGYNYINKSLYHFYRVLWKASIISEWFRQAFMFHSNFGWAFEFLYIKDYSNNYNTCSEYLMKMFEMYCNDMAFRSQWAIKYLKLGMDNRHKAWSKVFKTTLWILDGSEEAQITFCKDGGLEYLVTAFAKRETNWTPQDLTEILEVLQTAVSWFYSANDNGNGQLLSYVLEHKQKAILSRLIDLLGSIFQEISHIGKLIHSILKDFYQVSENAKVIIIDKVLFNIQHEIEPFNPKNDEWIADHYISICELCSSTNLDGDETIVESISDLVVILLVKSLQLDNPFVTLRLLQLLMSLPEDTFLSKPQVIQLYTGLLPLHYLNINENEAILSKFVSFFSDKFGTFLPDLSQESIAELKSNWNKFVDQFIQALSVNQTEFPELYIKALITMKKAFGSSFLIDKEKIDELNILITKFSNESHTELVEQWKELYKFF
jgi:hypothetical protein